MSPPFPWHRKTGDSALCAGAGQSSCSCTIVHWSLYNSPRSDCCCGVNSALSGSDPRHIRACCGFVLVDAEKNVVHPPSSEHNKTYIALFTTSLVFYAVVVCDRELDWIAKPPPQGESRNPPVYERELVAGGGSILGKGAFGVTRLAQSLLTGEYYAVRGTCWRFVVLDAPFKIYTLTREHET